MAFRAVEFSIGPWAGQVRMVDERLMYIEVPCQNKEGHVDFHNTIKYGIERQLPNGKAEWHGHLLWPGEEKKFWQFTNCVEVREL